MADTYTLTLPDGSTVDIQWNKPQPPTPADVDNQVRMYQNVRSPAFQPGAPSTAPVKTEVKPNMKRVIGELRATVSALQGRAPSDPKIAKRVLDRWDAAQFPLEDEINRTKNPELKKLYSQMEDLAGKIHSAHPPKDNFLDPERFARYVQDIEYRNTPPIGKALKNVAAGAMGVGSGLAGVGEWAGIPGAKELRQTIQNEASSITPSDPSFWAQVGQGVGSSLPFFVTGYGLGAIFGKATAMMGRAATPAVQAWVQAGGSGVTEALVEAGGTYGSMIDDGKAPGEAAAAARRVFWADAVLTSALNRYGEFLPDKSRMKRLVYGVPSEALEEGQQTVAQNLAEGKPWDEGLLDAMGVGGLIGGGMAFARTTPPEEAPKVRLEAGPPESKIATPANRRPVASPREVGIPDSPATYKAIPVIVPIDTLLQGASHQVTDRFKIDINPQYKGQQPRDLSDPASVARIQNIAKTLRPAEILSPDYSVTGGSPKIDHQGTVLQGNTRTLSLDMARRFEPESWKKYQDALKERFPDQYVPDGVLVDVLEHPTFPGLDLADDDRRLIGNAGNRSQVGRLSEAEQAMVDAEALPIDIESRLKLGVSGLEESLTQAGNQALVNDWLNLVPESEHKDLLVPGTRTLNEAGRSRFARAIVARALGPGAFDVIRDELTEAGVGKRVMAGLENGADALLSVKRAADEGNEIAKEFQRLMVLALGEVQNAKRQVSELGGKIEQYFLQDRMFADELSMDAAAFKIGAVLATGRSVKQIGEAIRRMGKAVVEYSGGGMFGEEMAASSAPDAINEILDQEFGSIDIEQVETGKPKAESSRSSTTEASPTEPYSAQAIKDLQEMNPAEFEERIDAITKLAKGMGVNVFQKLKVMGVAGQFENPTRKHLMGRVQMAELPIPLYADALAHEVGHAIDSVLSNRHMEKTSQDPLQADRVGKVKKWTAGDFRVLFNTTDKTELDRLQNELVELTIALEGSETVSMAPEYYFSTKEMWARFMQSVMFHPGLVNTHAPLAFSKLADQALIHPEINAFMDIAKGKVLDRPAMGILTKFFGTARQMYIKALDHYLGSKAYGEEVVYRARRALAEQEMEKLLKSKFEGVKDKPEHLMAAAEGILVTQNGVPEFGTRMYKDLEIDIESEEFEDLSKQKKAALMKRHLAYLMEGYEVLGVNDDGTVRYWKWRKAPDEARMAYERLSDAGKELIKNYTADVIEARDVFQREYAKLAYDLQGEREGYVHHYFLEAAEKGFAGRSGRFKERKASARRRRKEAEGYEQNFRAAITKTLGELENERLWREYVHRALPMIGDHYTEGDEIEKGNIVIEGSLKTGFKGPDSPGGMVIMKEDGRAVPVKGTAYQVPAEIWKRVELLRQVSDDAGTMAKILNSLNRYWQVNALVAPAAWSTNLISGALQLGGKFASDFYMDTLTADLTMGRTRANIVGLMRAMTPNGYRHAQEWVFGGKKNTFYGQFIEAQGLDVVGLNDIPDKLLAGYQWIEVFFKKVIVEQEAGRLKPDALTDPEFIDKVNEVIDLWAYDYMNVPTWMLQWKTHPLGSGVKPFITYPYKLTKMYTTLLGAPFDRNLTWQERTAKFMALGTIMAAINLLKNALDGDPPEEKEPPPGYDPKEAVPAALRPRGAMRVGSDAEGNDVHVSLSKYPWLNLYSWGESLAKGDIDGAREMLEDTIGGLGPVGDVSLSMLGYQAERDKYKSWDVRVAESAASFIPGARNLKDIADAMDPKTREFADDWQHVLGAYWPTTDAKTREAMAGKARLLTIPLPPGLKMNDKTTTTVEFPKYPQDRWIRFFTGVNIRRVNPRWYKLFEMRAKLNLMKAMTEPTTDPQKLRRQIELRRLARERKK